MMKKAIFFLVMALGMAVSAHAQRVVIGQKAPELKNVTWLDDRIPAATEAGQTLIVFFHPSNGESLPSHLTTLTEEEDMRVIVVTEQPAETVAPILRSYLSDRLGVALDPDKKTFAAFGIQYTPFSVLTDAKNRVQWMGNPHTLNPKL